MYLVGVLCPRLTAAAAAAAAAPSMSVSVCMSVCSFAVLRVSSQTPLFPVILVLLMCVCSDNGNIKTLMMKEVRKPGKSKS